MTPKQDSSPKTAARALEPPEIRSWRIATGAVRADLAVARRGHLRARWNLRRRLAQATITGEINGRRLRVTMPAP